MKSEIDVCQGTYSYSVLTYDTETLSITYKSYSWNSHGTTETFHGEENVNPLELFPFLVKCSNEERAREIMADPALQDICKRYAEQVQPFLQAFQELQRMIPLDWNSWEIGARLYASGSSTIFEAIRKIEPGRNTVTVHRRFILDYFFVKSMYQKYGEMMEHSISPHSQKSTREKRYLHKKVLEGVQRDSLMRLRSDIAVLKFCEMLPSNTSDDLRVVCAFLMRHRSEDTIHRLDAWHLMPAAKGRRSWLVLMQQALQTLSSGVPNGLSHSSDVYRLYHTVDEPDDNSLFSPSKSRGGRWVAALPPEYVLSQGRRIAKALSLCHRNGIVHRDVTVDNLFCVNGKNDLCLGDFGIACRLPVRFSRVSHGTPIFIPPEMIEGQPYDFSVDVFALGRCMQLMLWGMQMPYASRPFWTGELERKKLRPAVSDALWQVLCKATAADASERYRDGSALLEALNAVETVSERHHDGSALPEALNAVETVSERLSYGSAQLEAMNAVETIPAASSRNRTRPAGKTKHWRWLISLFKNTKR